MGDNIRLRGPLGLKQDVYDQARSEEWNKIIKIDDPKVRIQMLEKFFGIDEKPKKEKDGGLISGKSKLTKRGWK